MNALTSGSRPELFGTSNFDKKETYISKNFSDFDFLLTTTTNAMDHPVNYNFVKYCKNTSSSLTVLFIGTAINLT